MTGMLASVSSLAEARVVLAEGVDVIDLKDPARGVLGAVSGALAKRVVRAVDGQRLISATLGDLPMRGAVVEAALRRMSATGVDVVKVGVFSPPSDALLGVFAAHAADAAAPAVVVVFFADAAPDFGLLNELPAAGVRGVIVDTADKTRGSLRALLTDAEVRALIDKAHALRLWIGLAGSLTAADVAPLLALAPDYLGFRGALCRSGQRVGALDREAVRALRRLIPSAAPPSRSSVVARPASRLSA